MPRAERGRQVAGLAGLAEPAFGLLSIGGDTLAIQIGLTQSLGSVLVACFCSLLQQLTASLRVGVDPVTAQQQLAKVCSRAGVASRHRHLEQFGALGGIPADPITVQVHPAQGGGGARVTLTSGLFQPATGLGVVLANALTVTIGATEIRHGVDVSLTRRSDQGLDIAGLAAIPLGAQQGFSRGGMARLLGPFKPVCRRGQVALDTGTIAIGSAQHHHGIGVALLGSFCQQTTTRLDSGADLRLRRWGGKPG